jgi:hypothetical protein
MKTLKILLLSIICFSLQGCPGESDDKPDTTISIVNNFSEKIYVFTRNSPSEVTSSMSNEIPILNLAQNQKHIDNVFYSAFDSNSKLWILIYKQSTLENNTWQEIKDQGLYDKRYDLTLEQLKALNYEIVYDGN